MPVPGQAGLWAWDENGNMIFDSTKYTLRIMGKIRITGRVTPTDIYVPLSGNQKRFAYTQCYGGTQILIQMVGSNIIRYSTVDNGSGYGESYILWGAQ